MLNTCQTCGDSNVETRWKDGGERCGKCLNVSIRRAVAQVPDQDDTPCLIVPYCGGDIAAHVLAYVEGFAAAGGDVRKVGLSCEHMSAVRSSNWTSDLLLNALARSGTEQLVIFATPTNEEAPVLSQRGRLQGTK